MRSVELFAGAGGLGIGVSLAGFEPLAVIEWDKWACDTLRENRRRGYPIVANWPLTVGPTDVRQFDFSSLPTGIELVTGGPPCQPFSLGGKHRAYLDDRDMFPATVNVVRTLRPKAFIIENVKGLTRQAFANYYQYILLQFEFPEVSIKKNETWSEHFGRLQKEKTSGRLHGTDELTYNVVPTLANAANFGVPQRRERVFIVGFRNDLGIEWRFPRETHSLDALLYDQWVTGDYWDRHGFTAKKRPKMNKAIQCRVAKLRENPPPSLNAWRTVRDALVGLTEPTLSGSSKFHNHRFQDGAKTYPGHTGCALDMPAKTLKAGDHGVPGGENMMVMDNGKPRYFTVRESARLQTFPDGYVFHGSWTETMRQLGNAVPVMLARIVAASVAEKLIAHELATAAKKVRRLRVA